MYNKELADERGLSPEVQDKISVLHDERDGLTRAMQSAIDLKDEFLKQHLLNRFREIELELQSLWGFEKDLQRAFLAELRIPGCNCPYLDNKDSRGFVRYFSKTCEWHK